MVHLVECLEENWGEIYVLTNRKLCQYSIDELRKQINDRSVLTLIGQCFKKKMNSHLRRSKKFKNCDIDTILKSNPGLTLLDFIV